MKKLPQSIESAIRMVFNGRKLRESHPDGTFDRAGRWYPSDDENADGFTSTVRGPSRAFPYSYMKAARTLRHVKALAAVRPDLILAEADRLKQGSKLAA